MKSRTGKHWFGSILLATWTFGCGGGHDSDPASSDPSEDGAVETPQVDMVGQALGTKEKCDVVPPDETVTGGTASWSTSRKYGHKGCSRGYLVDLNDYVPFVSDPSAPSWPASVRCDEGLPATESECERLRVVTYVWERSGESTTYVGSSDEWAIWNGNNCVNALIFLNSLDVTEGDDLRLASACRKHNLSNDPSSAYSRQKLRFDL